MEPKENCILAKQREKIPDDYRWEQWNGYTSWSGRLSATGGVEESGGFVGPILGML